MMKRRMIFWMIGMLLSLLPSVASSPDSLVFKYLPPENQAYINVPMVINIQVTNTAKEEDYYGWWCLGEKADWKNSQAVEIKAGETVELAFEITISQPGEVRLHVFDLMTGDYLYGFYIYFNTVKPEVEATIEVNLEQDDEGNRFIYSDYSSVRIAGSFTLTNLGETPLINTIGVIGPYHDLFQVVLVPQIEEQDFNTIYGMKNEIIAGETCSRYYGFTISGKPIEGQEYTVQLKYTDHVLATSEPFTIRRCTNTYWTADLRRKNLPVVDNVLKVPGDALAVDMRGLYDINTIFSIDVSEANPNCLYYLGFLDYVPKGFDSEANIIRNGEASMVTIDSNYDFYCPESFKTKTAMFTYTPISESRGPASPIMSQRMSGMIILPFGAQKAWLSGTNEYHPESPFYNDDFKVTYLFDVKSDGTLVFKPIIGDYHDKDEPASLGYIYPILIYDIKPSPVVFYSEDIDIWSSIRGGDIAEGEIFQYGSMTTRKAEKYSYSWNCDRNCFCLNEEGATIRPFNVTISKWSQQSETCVDEGLEVYPHEILFDPEATGIESISNLEGNNSHELIVYTLSGQPVGTATYTNGQIKTEGLKPGLYVAGGWKILIK